MLIAARIESVTLREGAIFGNYLIKQITVTQLFCRKISLKMNIKILAICTSNRTLAVTLIKQYKIPARKSHLFSVDPEQKLAAGNKIHNISICFP